jgi:hypothetical protein
MEFELDRYLEIPEVDKESVRPQIIIRKVPIYKIPLNKKGHCKSTVTIETKEGPKVIQRCKNAGKEHLCSECVKLAKKIYKLNRRDV